MTAQLILVELKRHNDPYSIIAQDKEEVNSQNSEASAQKFFREAVKQIF